jgi:hypothetical protein
MKITPARERYYQNLFLNGVLWLNLALFGAYIGVWFMALQQEMFWRADFTAFYTGGSIVAQGKGSELFNKELQTRLQQEILGGRSFQDGVLYYNYPPHAVFAFEPLSKLPLTSAYYVWTLIQLVLLGWLLHILLRVTHGLERKERWLITSASLAMPFLMLNFMLGAFSLFVLNCLFESFLALKNSKEISAGVWLGLVLVKPQAMVYPAVLFLGARRWRALGGMIFFVILAGGISSSILGWQIWIDFAKIVQSTSSLFDSFGVNPREMYNLKGMLTVFLGNERGGLINAVSQGMFLAVGSLILILWAVPRQPSEGFLELRYAITILAGLFFSPHLNPQDGLILTLPALLFYLYLRKHNLPYKLFAVIALLSPVIFLLSEFALTSKLDIHLPSLAMLAFGFTITKILITQVKTVDFIRLPGDTK